MEISPSYATTVLFISIFLHWLFLNLVPDDRFYKPKHVPHNLITNKSKKLKCTLVQALRLCTGRTAHWGSRSIALLFHDQRHQKGVRGQRRATAALYPRGKTRYPLYRRLGGPQGWPGQARKISPPPGFDPRTAQPVASRYTDWSTRPTNLAINTIINTVVKDGLFHLS